MGSLASPVSSGEPLLLSGDVGGWMVFEQKLYRVPRSDDRGIGIFARISGAPADRNLIDRYADAGTNSSDSTTAVPATSSELQPATHMYRSAHRRSMQIIAHSSIPPGRRGVSRAY
jgi:hypothetical protein